MLRRCYSTALVSLERDAARLLHVVRTRLDSRSVVLQSEDGVSKSKQLKQLDKLDASWKVWLRAREAFLATEQYLTDPDPIMRTLATDEQASQLTTLSTLLTKTFPSLLLSSSSSSSSTQTQTFNALIELKSGVGGAESSIFVGELVRLYVRYAHSRGWDTVVNLGGEGGGDMGAGGVKDATIEVVGREAYDAFRWESGVHRVQRVPETESAGRIHTSTVAVVVLPLPEEKTEQEELFDMKDIRIEVMRSRGAGGQHVNKTESAVRLTHTPTGLTVSMQDTRSQHQNRERAFRILRARLLDRRILAEQESQRSQRRTLVRSVERSEKIRTYNFPQNRVTDHRIGLTVHNIHGMMEGNLLGEFLDGLKAKYEREVLESVLDG